MSLRRQLLLASLLLLSLPWAGCQFVREMESVMREGQAQSLKATARAVAAGIAARPTLLYPQPNRLANSTSDGGEIYAPPSPGPIILDGYGDGWPDEQARGIGAEADATAFSLSYQALTHDDRLFLLLHVRDVSPTYYNPSAATTANGDRLVLQTGNNRVSRRFTMVTSAPGEMHVYRHQASGATLRDRRIRGFWQDAGDGYVIELAIPLEILDARLGFYAVDADADGDRNTLGNIRPGYSAMPPWLVTHPPALSQSLAQFASPGLRLVVADRDRWVIGQATGSADEAQLSTPTFWLLRLLFRSILKPHPYRQDNQLAVAGKRNSHEVNIALAGKEQVAWYRSADAQPVMAGSAPVISGDKVIGVVVAERDSEEYLSLTDRAVSKLLSFSLLAVAVSAMGLLSFAAILSWRIRKLSRASKHVLDEQGQLAADFPRSTQRDEIGDLSRAYADLLDRLREYHDYLRNLSRKLSHELRTPIAVIRSSLEHLEDSQPPTEIYLSRAREGLQRLSAILNGMSEATRLEDSIRADTRQLFDLPSLLREVSSAYRDIYPTHRFVLELQIDQAPICGSPELMVQCLDKLVDNACSFAPKNSEVKITLAEADPGWLLTVENAGPLLPAAMHQQLFDSLVSIRSQPGEELHLGLGLHIARLVVDYHHGEIKAENLADDSGVRIFIILPKHVETAG